MRNIWHDHVDSIDLMLIAWALDVKPYCLRITGRGVWVRCCSRLPQQNPLNNGKQCISWIRSCCPISGTIPLRMEQKSISVTNLLWLCHSKLTLFRLVTATKVHAITGSGFWKHIWLNNVHNGYSLLDHHYDIEPYKTNAWRTRAIRISLDN